MDYRFGAVPFSYVMIDLDDVIPRDVEQLKRGVRLYGGLRSGSMSDTEGLNRLVEQCKGTGEGGKQQKLLLEAERVLWSYEHAFGDRLFYGSRESQLLYEAYIGELGRFVVQHVPGTKDAERASELLERQSLRIGLLEDFDRAFGKSAKAALDGFRRGEYDSCARECEGLISATFGEVPRVELLLGVSLLYQGEIRKALQGFRKVADAAVAGADPELASRATFLFAYGLILNSEYDGAEKVLKSLVNDYPRTEDRVAAQKLLLSISERRKPGNGDGGKASSNKQ
jgi:hypothetical protein